jgi:hypothetical protein
VAGVGGQHNLPRGGQGTLPADGHFATLRGRRARTTASKGPPPTGTSGMADRRRPLRVMGPVLIGRRPNRAVDMGGSGTQQSPQA